MEEKLESSPTQSKSSIDALSKEELIQKYKGLLGIAKKAKQAKDEFAEDNRKLKEALQLCETQKEADKKAIIIMKETLEQFTEQKLKLTNDVSELQKKNKADEESLAKLRIENESLQRQLNRLNEDNEALLKDIDRMEDQLKQVNILGIEQKKHLGLLELEVKKLKEVESANCALQNTVSITQGENKALKEQDNRIKQTLEELSCKYSRIKEINTEQRHKFNALKDRFVEVHRKLKNLKECKRVLLETQNEYADAVSKWQMEIIKASQMLFTQMNSLQEENEQLRQKLNSVAERKCESETTQYLVNSFNVESFETKLLELEKLCDYVRNDMLAKDTLLSKTRWKKNSLPNQIAPMSNEPESEKMLEVLTSHSLRSEQLQSQVDSLMQELSHLKSQLNDCETERNSLKLESNIRENLQIENKELKIAVESLNKKLNETQQVHEDLQQIRNTLKALEQDKISLLEQLQQKSEKQKNLHSEENIQFTEKSYIDLQSRYSHLEREHADLLCEMRELNEALKARGDVISRQQEKQQELINELRRTNTKLKQIDEKLLQKDAAIAEKEAQVREVKREIDLTRQQTRDLEIASVRSEEQLRVLNEELHSFRNNADTQSEILSTSTMSRNEELSRLREVDESFEEKYNKMRGLALKLKKRLQEQTTQFTEMEQQQSGYVALKAECEELRKQLKVCDEQEKLIETLKSENQKLKSSRKQANVLNLEIEAAEKSLMEATNKLSTRTSELETLNALLTNREHTITQLRKEITIVESAKESETTHAKELKEQVDMLQEQLKDAVHAKQLANQARKQLELTEEALKQELEQIKLEVSQCSAESSATVIAAHNEKEKIEQQLHKTVANLSETETKLHNVELALNNLRVEHSEYKQKAQAVLRKHQSIDTTRERELAEELAQVRSLEEQQRQIVNEQTTKLTILEHHNADLRMDNENLKRRVQELCSLEDELRQQNERLSQEQRSQLQEHQESLRTHRLQLEAAHECHKQQLHEIQSNYQQQIDELSSMQGKAVRLLPIIGANANERNSFSIQTPVYSSEKGQSQQIMLAEREDAEGSEEASIPNNNVIATNNKPQSLRKVSSSSRRSQHDFMPLDELLNMPMQAFQTDTVTSGRNDSGLFDFNSGNGNAESLQVELHVTRELLAKQESRIRHLTALLAENEQDLAKLTQMNDMLKEELRRQERAVEREKHMHNAEYLKNVVLKFLTLTSGDERVRLVPVLNTILKLSRNETETLNCVAKGQKLPTESQGRGWGNFLPLFGGGSNNN
uniref:GRIP and coiled-coil domain-containing protein 2 n=1 Tax=Ceratitis capitata TaxID=7213 RepID=W8B798_CERCA